MKSRISCFVLFALAATGSSSAFLPPLAKTAGRTLLASSVRNDLTNGGQPESFSESISIATTTLHPSTLPTTPPKKYWWQKHDPKGSLAQLDTQQSHTAARWILNLIDAGHWSLMVPLFLSSYGIILHINDWLTFFGGDALRTTLWCTAPLVLAAASLPPIVAHMYEDWQVVPSRNFETARDDQDIGWRDYNNERLRGVAFNALFGLIAVAAIMNHHALSGFQTLPLSLVMVAIACLGDQNHRVSDYISSNKWSADAETPIMPVPVTTMVLLAYAVVVQSLSLWELVTQHLQGPSPLLVLAVRTALLGSFALIGIGGSYEGLVTETTFNQWDHFKAYNTMLVGASVQAWALWQISNTVSLV